MQSRKIQAMAAGIVLAGIFLVASGCSESMALGGSDEKSVVASLDGAEAFRQALTDAGPGLVVVEFYADWCTACRRLSPVLEEIARRHSDKAFFYKLDLGHNRGLGRALRITGIPYVMFFRDGRRVHDIVGAQRREAYIEALNRL